MPTTLLHTDASLISGQDHATVWKRSPDSAFFESDTSFTQIAGNFQNGGTTRCGWYNSIQNSLLVDTHMHITVKNNDSSNDVTLLSVASLIAKLIVYINNVEVCKINNVNNCFILEQLEMMKQAKDKDEYHELFHGQQGRVAPSANVFTVIAKATSVTIIVDMNKMLGGLFNGLDNRAQKCSVEITWRTDSAAQDVSQFLKASANSDEYADLQYSNIIMRNKYEILDGKYLTKQPFWKPLILVERQLQDITTGTQVILKLSDIFSEKKKCVAIVVQQQKHITDYSDADCFATTPAYGLSYSIYQNGREVKTRTEAQSASDSARNWLRSIDAVLVPLADSHTDYNPWLAGAIIPLSNIYIDDNKERKYLRGFNATQPASNYEVHLTIQNSGSRTSKPSCELFLLYTELCEIDPKGQVKIYS